MAVRVTVSASAAILGNTGGIEAVFPAGAILEGRSGSQPASAALAATGTLLCSITLPADPWAAADALTGKVSKQGVWSDAAADAAGTIGHWRLKQAADAGSTDGSDERIDFAASGDGVTVDNPTVTLGQPVTVNTLSMSIAAP